MNKFMKVSLITGLLIFLIGTLTCAIGYYSGGQMSGVRKAYPNGRIDKYNQIYFGED